MSGNEPDRQLVEQVRRRLAGLGRDWTPMDVAHAILDCGQVASDKTVLAVVEELRRTSTGAGRLEPLLVTDGVTDVLVNGPDQVFIDRGKGLELTDVTFSGPEEVRALAVRLAAAVGRRLDDGNPWWMPDCLTAPEFMPSSTSWPDQEPVSACACRRDATCPSTTGWPGDR